MQVPALSSTERLYSTERERVSQKGPAVKKPMLFPDDHLCFLCRSPYVELHHVYPSSRRPISDREGAVVWLCHKHHQGRLGVHSGDRTLDQWLKAECQRRWEKREGISDPEHREFIALMGKSYLED